MTGAYIISRYYFVLLLIALFVITLTTACRKKSIKYNSHQKNTLQARLTAKNLTNIQEIVKAESRVHGYRDFKEIYSKLKEYYGKGILINEDLYGSIITIGCYNFRIFLGYLIEDNSTVENDKPFNYFVIYAWPKTIDRGITSFIVNSQGETILNELDAWPTPISWKTKLQDSNNNGYLDNTDEVIHKFQ